MKIRVLAAAVAGAVTIFVCGYLIYGIVLAAYLKENMIQYAGLNKEPVPDFAPLLLSNLVLALLLAFIFESWAKVRTLCGRREKWRRHHVPDCSQQRPEFHGIYESLQRLHAGPRRCPGGDREGRSGRRGDRRSPGVDESKRVDGAAEHSAAGDGAIALLESRQYSTDAGVPDLKESTR